MHVVALAPALHLAVARADLREGLPGQRLVGHHIGLKELVLSHAGLVTAQRLVNLTAGGRLGQRGAGAGRVGGGQRAQATSSTAAV